MEKSHSKRKVIVEPLIKGKLEDLGERYRHARLRRNMALKELASDSKISEATLKKIERGDPSVTLAAYINVIHTLGLITELDGLLSEERDIFGRMLTRQRASTSKDHATDPDDIGF